MAGPLIPIFASVGVGLAGAVDCAETKGCGEDDEDDELEALGVRMGSDSWGESMLLRDFGDGAGDVEFGEELGGLFFKFSNAGLAAEHHRAVRLTGLPINVCDGLAHPTELSA